MCISETICSAVCKALWCDVCEREKNPTTTQQIHSRTLQRLKRVLQLYIPTFSALFGQAKKLKCITNLQPASLILSDANVC